MHDLIKPGALVTLKSGSPPMTVSRVGEPIKGGIPVNCVYFNTATQELNEIVVKMDLLQVVRPTDEDLKVGEAVPLSPVGVYFAFNTEEERDEFMSSVVNGPDLSSSFSTTQH